MKQRKQPSASAGRGDHLSGFHPLFCRWQWGWNRIGDSLGPLGRLNHLKNLRVTVLWLNSHYDTPNVDNGYDILIIGRSLKISGHWTI
ncbi:MAG: alpha-amylase family glycosyl hydrolase [Gluconobacter cerinus]